MSDPVKSPEPPDRPFERGRGQARTRFARRAVVTAARTLFLERGYAATTVEAISDLADVPPATVYRHFNSKVGILKALIDTSIAGDDQPVPVQTRPEVASLLTESDPLQVLTGLARITTAINQRTNAVYHVLVEAARSDLKAGDLLDEVQQQRDTGQTAVARELARGGSLREGLSSRDANDLIHALMSPEMYRLLVVDRNWPPDKYERWLAATLAQQLM